MDLAKRGGMRGLLFERAELFLPVGAQFSAHPAFHERPSHGRGFSLQLAEFGGIFGRQEIRNGRHHLGHLHQRTFGLTERSGQRTGNLFISLIPPEQALRGEG